MNRDCFVFSVIEELKRLQEEDVLFNRVAVNSAFDVLRKLSYDYPVRLLLIS